MKNLLFDDLKNLRFLHRFLAQVYLKNLLFYDIKNLLFYDIKNLRFLHRFFGLNVIEKFIFLWHEKSLLLIEFFYVMMIVSTLYKPNINAVAKHISCVLLKFVTYQADVF